MLNGKFSQPYSQYPVQGVSVQDQLAPDLNRFVILLLQHATAKFEFYCFAGKFNVNISHEMGSFISNDHQPIPKYSDILKKKMNMSLQRRTAERAEEAQQKVAKKQN